MVTKVKDIGKTPGYLWQVEVVQWKGHEQAEF